MTPNAIRLEPGVFRLGSSMVNWYAVEDGGRLTVVDAGVPRHADGLEEALGAIGHEMDDIDAVVLTHGHSDHTGVAGLLHERGVPIQIHHTDAELLASGGRTKSSTPPATRWGTARSTSRAGERSSWATSSARGTR